MPASPCHGADENPLRDAGAGNQGTWTHTGEQIPKAVKITMQ
jgi:hypothetical protein